MSYSTLPNNATFLDAPQLPAVLQYFEHLVTRVYNDGNGNPTIGIGLNLTNSDNLAIVLYEIAPSLFTNPPQGGTQAMVAAFETIISNNQLTGPADGLSSSPNPSTSKLINLRSRYGATAASVALGRTLWSMRSHCLNAVSNPEQVKC
jgi:hypothetical protein